MKITYIVNQITQLGGIERVISMLSNYFVNNYGYRIKIISLNTEASGGEGFKFNSKIRIKHCGYSVDEYTNRCLLNRRIRDILKNEEAEKTDIIITCHGNIANLVALNRKHFGGKIIFTEHASWEYYTKARKLAQLLLYRRADKLIVLTEAAAEVYRKYGLKNIEIIPNAVGEIRCFADEGHKNHELVAIGRLEEVKGYDNLIEAVKHIKGELGNWKILIYGSGTQEDKLREQIKKNNVEKYIELAGPTDKVLEILHESSGYLLSSRSEAFPMVVLEALSCGTPVISYGFPAIKEINSRHNAILEVMPRNDFVAFGKAIIEFIKNKRLRKTLARRSFDTVKDYSLANIAEKWRELLERLTENQKK